MARASLYDYKKESVLLAIKVLTDQHGRAPSLREVAEESDTSVATLHSYLTKLRIEGLVSWSERHHRSLRVAPPSRGSAQNGSAAQMSPTYALQP